MATLQEEPTKKAEVKEPIPTAKYEIRNANMIQPLVRKYPDKEVPYPSNEAKDIADKFFKKDNRIELENTLFDIDDAKKRNQREIKIKGDLSDKTHHALFEMGFRMKMGYDQKPAHMINANVEAIDYNKPYVIISWQ